MTAEARWFLAHAKLVEDPVIDAWRDALQAHLRVDGHDVRVIPGRDDYKARSRGLGGWNSWVRDCASGETWDGQPLFHGIIVPVPHLDAPSIGRGTQALVEGFLRRGKHAYGWNFTTGALAKILDVRALDGDSWTMTALLTLEVPDAA